jgi:hypothetical protein
MGQAEATADLRYSRCCWRDLRWHHLADCRLCVASSQNLAKTRNSSSSIPRSCGTLEMELRCVAGNILRVVHDTRQKMGNRAAIEQTPPDNTTPNAGTRMRTLAQRGACVRQLWCAHTSFSVMVRAGRDESLVCSSASTMP